MRYHNNNKNLLPLSLLPFYEITTEVTSLPIANIHLWITNKFNKLCLYNGLFYLFVELFLLPSTKRKNGSRVLR